MILFPGGTALYIDEKLITGFPATILFAFTASFTDNAHTIAAQVNKAGLSRAQARLGAGGGQLENVAANESVGNSTGPAAGWDQSNAAANVVRWGLISLNSLTDREAWVGSIGNGTTQSQDVNWAAHDRFLIGGLTINGAGVTEGHVGHIGEVHLYAGKLLGYEVIPALVAQTSKPEDFPNRITGWRLENASSLGSDIGTHTLTVIGSGTLSNGTVTHPVNRSADVTAPTITAAAVANSTPTVVSLTASESLDTSNVPAASAFTVSGHTVSSVAIVGAAINLTVSAAFVNGEAARTVSYTQPGTANARDVAGNLLANFSGLSITNNVAAPGDTTPPAFASAQVTNSQRTIIQVTMNETLAASVPPTSAFTASGGRTVTGVSLNGTVASVTVNTAYAYGDTITIAYTQPGSNPRLQDASGNLTATFAAQSVTNNIAATTASLPWPLKADGVTVRPLVPVNGSPRTAFAYRVAIYNADTDALVLRKTGQTAHATTGAPQAITAESALTAGAWYRRDVISDADRTVIGSDTAQAV